MQKTDSSYIEIRFTMTQELQNSLKDILNTISTFHCAHSFVKDCIDSYEKRKKVHRDFGEDIPEGFLSTRPYLLSQDQVAFFQSDAAEEMFADSFLREEFLGQIRNISIQNT